MNFKNYLFAFTLLISFVYSTKSISNDVKETDYKNMEQMIGSIRLEKKQVEGMIDKMITSGRLSAEEGQKAKREIASVKEDDLEDFKTLAIAEVKNKR